jgi:transcriptional regulator with PAS, ATPase and Fis domain
MNDEKGDYAETLLNVVLDEIDDIIMIHDSQHTLVWMNRAGLKEFGVTLDDILGKRCYSLMGRNRCCDDCDVASMEAATSKGKKIKTVPRTKNKYICTSIPLYQDGKIKLVVQHLSKLKDKPIGVGNE